MRQFHRQVVVQTSRLHRSWSDERGIALVTVMLVLLMTSSILAGFLVVTSTDQKLRAVDRSRTQAFYAAHAGLEKLTSDLGNLFATDFSPEAADLRDIESVPPDLANVEFVATDGLGYHIEPTDTNGDGEPDTEVRTIESGPYQGLTALVTKYTVTSTARVLDGSEARLQRSLQTVSIPVFQFGIFSETDLSFFAGPSFNFGGRVQTNGNLFLASGSSSILTLANRVHAFLNVVRTNLSNGWPVTSSYTGAVKVSKAPGVTRDLATTEGSLVGTLGSALNEPKWTNLSLSTYNGNMRNSRTGARNLQLALTTVGATPIDLIRRPVPGEAAIVTTQRMFAQASLRILLSDTAADITNLPGVSADAPVPLGRLADTPIAGYTVDATHAPLSAALGDPAFGYRLPANTPLHGGFLKIEYRNAGGAWVDATVEILNLGFTRRNIEVGGCAEPSPNAVIRFQRIKTSPSTGGCGNGSLVDTDYWPQLLYDTREGRPRDTVGTGSGNIYLSGVMHFVELDVNNLRRWLLGQTGASGTNAIDEDGYLVYFSDRRGNRNAAGNETGEFGWEDNVNPASSTGAPNGALDEGEDVNVNGALDNYGATPIVPAGGTAPLDNTATLSTVITSDMAKRNRPVFFRRALKIVNGTLGNLPATGLTVTAENPVYVVGPYNATNTGYGTTHPAAAVVADAVTLLSQNWSDANSLANPNNPANRARATTWYRFAVIAGKGRSFNRTGVNCGATCYQDYGTDGGAHNFLRFLEGGGQTLNYRGSLVSFYYNRQAVGIYKCCVNVYSPPTRGYIFDTDFLSPPLLPPKTPMFRDLNTTGFVPITRRH